MESRKRVASSPTISNRAKQRKLTATPLPMNATKASLARAKAVNAQLTGTKPGIPRRKKLEEPKTLTRLSNTTAAGLKERPVWDIRGRMTDMTSLLKMNEQRLEELEGFKRELEITKSEKESQEKEKLQQAAALRTQIQEMERAHTINIEELNANQRIEYQRLEDDNLNFSRRLTTIETEVTDAKRKLNVEVKQLDLIKEDNQALRTSIDTTTTAFEKLDHENRHLENDMKKLQESLRLKEKEIEGKESRLAQIDASVQVMESKLAESNADRERLLNKIKDLEVKKKLNINGKSK